MRKINLLFVFIAMTLFIFNTGSNAQVTEVKVGKGDLKIGGIFQAGYDYSLGEDSLEVNGQFTLNRARFLFFGSIIPDKVKYFIQTEGKQTLVGGNVTTPYVLDFKMTFVNLFPKTSLSVGRFLPNFTVYMPAPTSKLDLINYPLLVTGGSAMGVSVAGAAVWRQVGLQTDTETDLVDFSAGIFNGLPANNLSDNNDGKDVLLRAAFKPKTSFAKVQVGGYAWLGNALMAEDRDLKYNMFGFFGTLKNDKLSVIAEYLMRNQEQAGNANELKSMGFYGQVGYKILPKIELLGRYDSVDPNTDTKDNGWNWLTLGANYYLDSYNAMIYLNYIKKIEENNWGFSDTIKNDILQLQFQVAF